MKKALLAVLLTALVGGGGFAYYHFIGFPEPAIKYEQRNTGEIVVNLQDESRRYLRTQIVIEYVYSKEADQKLTAREAKIRDSFIAILRSKTSEELMNVDNLPLLRTELLSELEKILAMPDTISDLWFVIFVIQ